jgi:diguanylate cyclase (GGDEF)-like protein
VILDTEAPWTREAQIRRRAPLWRRIQGHWNDLVGSRAEDELLVASDRSAGNPGLLILAFLAAIGAMAVVTGVRDRVDSFGTLMALVGAAVGFEVISQMVERRRPRLHWLIQLKVAFFAVGIGAAIWVSVRSPDAVAYTRHPIVFLIYLLLITTAGLRDEPRLPLGAGLYALLSYVAVGLTVPGVAAESGPVKAAALLRDFDGTAMISHSLMLICTTAMAVASARRGQAVRRLSLRDGLTGLANRQVFEACLSSEAERARRSGQPLSVAMIDVDFFKSLNDTYGHAFGDEVLRWIARRLRESFRSTDLVARYGGEEFVVVFVDSSDDRLVARLDALRERIASTVFHPGQSAESVRVTVSVGVGCWPADAPNVRAALAVADERLYLAKGAGRNRVVAESPPR